MYTSGTTGRPKGVMITHANLAWKNLAHIIEFGFTSADLGLACGPLYHVGALDLTTTSLIAAGATMIIHRSFDAAAVVDELERSRVTTVWLAPAMVNAIMALPDVEERDLSSVRLIINGGEKMPIPLIERIQRTFPSAWFADAYGLTETVSGDTFLDRDSIVTKLGSVGRPCLYLELDIWDEQGRSVPPGERGEIVLRGPKVFKGYWRDPDATAAAFAGGWFHTGDIGVRDEDGYLFIVDRLKDMIVSGGENIAGSEVERVLYEHDRSSRRPSSAGPTTDGARSRWRSWCCAAAPSRDGRRARRALPRPSWRATRSPRRSPSSTRCRATRPARCSSASSGPDEPARPPATQLPGPPGARSRPAPREWHPLRSCPGCVPPGPASRHGRWRSPTTPPAPGSARRSS